MAQRRKRTLPTGTVTFLFTDIEGSTRLLQALGDGYRAVLETHAGLIRAALRNHRGTEVSTEGDAFFAVFPSATDALAAAVEGQLALAAHPWPDGMPVKVRMGLHAGAGQLGGDNYVGLDVHRAARIASAAHGGQILISAATRALTEGAMPNGVTARDMGRHRLKDLDRDEHLTAILVPGLPADFPALRTAHPTTGIPPALTTFLGRDGEIETIWELLGGARLVTLTGPGGIGKTRLASEVARRHEGAFEHGASLVVLDAVQDPSLVATSIAQVLRLREQRRPVEEVLADYLAPRETLLVLDNFEQLLVAAGLVERLLQVAPRLRLLVTSRIPLQVPGEQEYPVGPLRLPDPASLPGLDELMEFEAVRLFVDRARAVRHGFALDERSAAAVVQICARVDGLPLAIELAGARIKLLPPEAILARLGQHLDLLSSQSPSLPTRQRSMLGAIQWSLDLLAEPDRRLFERLSVFSGSWDLSSAETICQPAELGLDLIDGVTSLVDQSLVRRIDDGGPRFALLRTIQDVAAEHLAARGDADRIARRHADYFRDIAEAAEARLQRGDHQGVLTNLLADQDNFRAALKWAVVQRQPDLGIGLAAAIWRFWQVRGQLVEGRQWLDRLLALPGASAPARARGLTAAGGLAYWQGDPAARDLYQEALDIFRALNDERGIADGLQNLAFSGMSARPEETVRLFQESLQRFRALNDERSVASVVGALGFIQMMTGQYAEAQAALEEAVALNLAAGARARASDNRVALGHVRRLTGDLNGAAALYREALAETREMGDAARMLMVLEVASQWASIAGRHADAVRLAAAVERSTSEQGGSISRSISVPGRVDAFGQARQSGTLDEDDLARAEADGRALELRAAVDIALAILARRE